VAVKDGVAVGVRVSVTDAVGVWVALGVSDGAGGEVRVGVAVSVPLAVTVAVGAKLAVGVEVAHKPALTTSFGLQVTNRSFEQPIACQATTIDKTRPAKWIRCFIRLSRAVAGARIARESNVPQPTFTEPSNLRQAIPFCCPPRPRC
jgi:hypothetical protein